MDVDIAVLTLREGEVEELRGDLEGGSAMGIMARNRDVQGNGVAYGGWRSSGKKK